MDYALISIVILTKNAGPAFRDTLDKIYAQKLNGEFELVIVDSGSTDGTIEMVKRYPARFYTISPEEFNFGRTRDYGFSLARGEFIATISQDVVPCDDRWLERMTANFAEDENIAATQGTTKLPLNADVFYWEKKESYYYTSDVLKWFDQCPFNLSFVNCAVRKSFWQNHHMGSIPFSEDKVFCKSIYEAGKKVEVVRDAACYHGHQYSFRSLIVRLLGEGVGWRVAGVRYGLRDCLYDIYKHKWLMKRAFEEYLTGNIKTKQELFFPIIRPLMICWGNYFGR